MREFVVGLSVLLCFSLYANAELPSSQPNVLMICIDDLNDWVGFLGGHPQALTPEMDSLAGRGRVFANAHCAFRYAPLHEPV